MNEFRKTSNPKVFLVRVLRVDDFFCLRIRSQWWKRRSGSKATYLLDSLQYVWLAVLVTVRAHSKVDFARILVSLECLGNSCKCSMVNLCPIPRVLTRPEAELTENWVRRASRGFSPCRDRPESRVLERGSGPPGNS